MGELVIKAPKITPAKVEFDKTSLLAALGKMLEPYQNIVVTKDTAKDAKKIVADLRKKAAVLDDHRKNVKKQLTEDVKLFEADMKDAMQKIQDAIDPIDEAVKAFEEAEKDQKREWIQKRVEYYADLHNLDDEHFEKIIQDPKWLNKGTSQKSINDSLDDQCATLAAEQIGKESNHKALKTFCDQQNTSFGTNVVPDPYLKLIGTMTIPEIMMQIAEDVQKTVRESFQKIQEELPIQNLEPDSGTHQMVEDEAEPKVVGQAKGEIFADTYDIEATEAQFEALEAWMDRNCIIWNVRDEE